MDSTQVLCQIIAWLALLIAASLLCKDFLANTRLGDLWRAQLLQSIFRQVESEDEFLIDKPKAYRGKGILVRWLGSWCERADRKLISSGLPITVGGYAIVILVFMVGVGTVASMVTKQDTAGQFAGLLAGWIPGLALEWWSDRRQQMGLSSVTYFVQQMAASCQNTNTPKRAWGDVLQRGVHPLIAKRCTYIYEEANLHQETLSGGIQKWATELGSPEMEQMAVYVDEAEQGRMITEDLAKGLREIAEDLRWTQNSQAELDAKTSVPTMISVAMITVSVVMAVVISRIYPDLFTFYTDNELGKRMVVGLIWIVAGLYAGARKIKKRGRAA